MPSIVPSYEYDIFISYRQKDNKHDGWVTKFVDNLKGELEATFKEDVSVYFDENPHDRLRETHNVDKSLEGKLKCLIFIPILSQTYCDPNSYAWQYEFLVFLKMAENDRFGKDVKLRSGNVTSRILPIRIHDMESEDIKLFEKETGSVLRALDFVFKTSTGVSRPLKASEDHLNDNLNKTFYSDQINKVAHAIKEIILGLKTEPVVAVKEKAEERESSEEAKKEERRNAQEKPAKLAKRKLLSGVVVLAILIIGALLVYPKIFKRNALEKLRSSGGRISIAVMPFQNMTNDTTWNVWQDGIQNNLITSLSNSEELKVRQIESISGLLQSKGLTNYASITPSIASKISQKLDANVFINGSINQSGPTIRVNAQLVNSKTEEIFKSFQIDGTSENILGVIDSLSGQVKNSLLISKLEKAVTKDFHPYGSTTSSEAYRNFIYGQNAFMKRDYPTAISFLIQALDLDPNFIYSSFLLAFAYRAIGKMDQAKEIALQNHIKRDQISLQSMKIWTDYQYAYFFETPLEQIKYIRQSQQLDDQLPFNNYDLGNAYINMSQYDKAIPEFNEALGIYKKWGVKPAWIYNYTDLGIAYHKTGQYKKEKKLYKKAEQDFPNDPVLIRRQATLSLTEGDTVATNGYIKNYISLSKERSSSDASIANNLALTYEEAGILNKAEEYYRQALSLEPENSERMNILAWFLFDKDRNIDEGLDLIEKALKLSPDDFYFIDTKGWGLYKQGKYEEALELLEKSWVLKPIYDHDVFLHIQEVKKAIANQKKNNEP
jgi:tetratricopeptide (TPR) repeat protein